MASKSYGWDVRNIAKISPKMAKKQSFFDFFDFLTTCSYDSNESESEGKRLRPTPLPHMWLWLFVEIKKTKIGALFSFSKIGNTCIKIGISVLHLVKLLPIYIFQIHPKSNFIFVFGRFECICKVKLIKKYLLDY